MRLNKDKHIGRVLFIVEGSQTEFSILRYIFCNLLKYDYIEKRRNRPTYFVSKQDQYSQVAVINTKGSNISDISNNENYLDDIFDVLRDEYKFPVDQSAIYYLFDRDPKSNTNITLIKDYIENLGNPYDGKNYYKAGQLLLSYPSIESYLISNFIDNAYLLCFDLGAEAKTYMGNNNCIQINKLSDGTIVKAANEFIKYLESEKICFDIDEFVPASKAVFCCQEHSYCSGKGFQLFSMLTLALLQMGVLEINS